MINPTPHCPKCGSTNLHDDYCLGECEILCKGCGAKFRPSKFRDYAQFFLMAPGSGVTVELLADEIYKLRYTLEGKRSADAGDACRAEARTQAYTSLQAITKLIPGPEKGLPK